MRRGLSSLALAALVASITACDSDGPARFYPDGCSCFGDASLPHLDGGPRDAGPPRPACDVGEPCNARRACRTSPDCIEEAIGGWPGGYCSTIACDPEDDESCGGPDCARCVELFASEPLCLRVCTPSLDDNPCGFQYACSLTGAVCLPGCTSDDQCAISGAPPSANARCDLVTHRCRHDGTLGAEAGEPCMADHECEADGDCLRDEGTRPGWIDGYCTKLGCDLPGNECAGDGTCQTRGFGFATCLAPCEVGATVDGTPFSSARDCRAGYACLWDGSAIAEPGGGGCVPANESPLRAPNIGAPCARHDECWSPYGLGTCRDLGAGRQCTVIDCAAPGIPFGACDAGAVCATVDDTTASLCLETCAVAEDCGLSGHGCWDTSVAGVATGGLRVCFPGCLADGDCRATERCEGATPTTPGECVLP